MVARPSIRSGRAGGLAGELAALGVGGLVIAPDPFFLARSARLGQLSLAHRIPAIFQYREFVAAGGVGSYAGNPTETYRAIGLYTARILKGEKPADLPVQQYAKNRADHQTSRPPRRSALASW